MGMAASQARFLGLTARKSNVEYQGQQINQQRTALSNESANLYSQMMELTVPTPPSTNEFYETEYTIDDTKGMNMTGDYKLGTVTKVYGKNNMYKVTLNYTESHVSPTTAKYNINKASKTSDGIYSFQIASAENTSIAKTLHYNENADNPIATDDKGNEEFKTERMNIYKLDYQHNNTYSTIPGFDEWLESMGDSEKVKDHYFFKDTNDKAYFMTEDEFKQLKGLAAPISEDGTSSSATFGNPTLFTFHTSYTYTKEYSTFANAELETSSKGRYSSITFSDDETTPESLRGLQRSISTKQVMNQQKYDDAFNDYEYEKYRYEKAISDINAKTEVIQNKDQQLELRLQQLNTEQDAIKTEMDSVSKVIEDNVDKTFKVFA